MSSEKESNGSDGKAASGDSGPSADVCAVVSEQEKQLAISAAADFKAGKYAACVETLDKLCALRPTDGKVTHNRAVARSYCAKSPKAMEEFIREILEASTQLHANFANPDSLDDVDQCIPLVNYAVALFHTSQYQQALAVLDRLFQFIEPMDEAVARGMCFLHIELCLCLQQPEKALIIVAYLENLLFGGKNASSSGESAPGAAGGPSPSTTPQKSPDREPAESTGAEAERSRLQLYKTRCLIMMRSVKASKREMKNLVNSSLGTSNQTVFLRSQLEFIRGNYRKAVKILCTAQMDNKDARTLAMYHNNMGCVHFCTGKPHLGSFHFEKALITYPHTSRDDPKRNLLDGRLYFELRCNLGLQNLYAGKYTSAFDCLVEAVRMQPNNARLWLRIAECCVNRHKSDNSTDFQLKDRKRLMIDGTAGAGTHRKIILSNGISSNKYTPQESDSSAAMPAPTLEFAALCLRNALQLLPDTHTASVASAGDSASISVPDDPPATPVADTAVGGTPLTLAVDDTSIAAVRNSVLALASYVALCLGDTLVALRHAENLLAQPRISGLHNFLGHMYAAEALLLLDRVGDAIEHLNPDLIKDMSYSFPEPEDSAANKSNKEETKTPSSEESGKTYRKPWFPATPSMAKVVSLYNLAVAYTLRGGGLGKATETLRLLSVPKGPDPEIPVQALMLAIYVQLQQGHADLAKNIIKQHLPQYK
ncbi:CCR4-NOT transcription complex subunit 10 [Haemaphysalis longicornis]